LGQQNGDRVRQLRPMLSIPSTPDRTSERTQSDGHVHRALRV
jgi:hypothetical protein